MTNNQNSNLDKNESQDIAGNDANSENKDFGEVKEAQNLGGGKTDGGVKVGQFGDDDFMQTDQTITQAAPGQTANSTNQGSSNI